MIRIILLLSVISLYSLSAQITGKSEAAEMMKEEFESKSLDQQMLEGDNLPIGNVVDPDHYYLGPGDKLMIKALPMYVSEKLLVVSPDNKIMLPRSGGVVDVSDKTLTEVKEEIEEAITKYKDNATVHISFFRSKLCLVSVEGNVLNATSFAVPGSYKVSKVIELANRRPTIADMPNKDEDYFIQKRLREKRKFEYLGGNKAEAKRNYWKRNVLILHEDGTSEIADLEKANVKGSSEYDPYVQQGDKIIVPFEKDDFPIISISGAVKRPIGTALKQGDRASDLLQFSYGLLPNADKENIYLFNGGEKIKLNVTDDLKLQGNDPELKPGAMIIVGKHKQKVNIEQGVVTISGYVNNEGSYPIENHKTTISEALEMAGGITDEAYLPLAKLIRDDFDIEQLSSSRSEAFKLFRKSNLSLEDTLRYLLDVNSMESSVSVDFQKVVNDPSYDVVLQNGDEIIIPTNPNRVYIFGRVNNPGFIKYKHGESIEYYVNKAGGMTNTADDSRVALIRQNNQKWLEGLDAIVFDGDYIYVPGEKDLPIAAEQAQYATIAAIAGTVASFGFLVIQIINLTSSNE